MTKLILNFRSLCNEISKSIYVLYQSPSFKTSGFFIPKTICNCTTQCLPLYFVFILICTILFIPLSFIDGIPEMPNLQLSDAWRIIILAPLLEELAFRLPLRNFFKKIFCDGYAGLCFCQNLYWHTTVNCLCNIDCNSFLYPKFRKPKRGCSRLFYFQVL